MGLRFAGRIPTLGSKLAMQATPKITLIVLPTELPGGRSDALDVNSHGGLVERPVKATEIWVLLQCNSTEICNPCAIRLVV